MVLVASLRLLPEAALLAAFKDDLANENMVVYLCIVI
jgi:hypothetical protein